MRYQFVEGDDASVLVVECIDAGTGERMQASGLRGTLRYWYGDGPVTERQTAPRESDNTLVYRFESDELKPGTLSMELKVFVAEGHALTQLEVARFRVRKKRQ